jgi:hypothetical protein
MVPGEVYAYLMQGVRDEEYDIEQGQKLAKLPLTLAYAVTAIFRKGTKCVKSI